MSEQSGVDRGPTDSWFGLERFTLGDGSDEVVVTLGPESHWDRSHLRRLRQSGDLPGMVPIVDADFAADGTPFAVTPAIAAPSLNDLVAGDDGADWTTAASVVEAAARASHEAHLRGLFHGAMSPDDIVVIDDDVAISGVGIGLGGTPPANRLEWTAPEVREGADPTERSDVYSLGKLLEFSLGDDLDTAPRSIRRLIMWSSSDTPEARPPSAQEFASILAEGLGDERQAYGPAFIPTTNLGGLASGAGAAVAGYRGTAVDDEAASESDAGAAAATVAAGVGAGAVAASLADNEPEVDDSGFSMSESDDVDADHDETVAGEAAETGEIDRDLVAASAADVDDPTAMESVAAETGDIDPDLVEVGAPPAAQTVEIDGAYASQPRRNLAGWLIAAILGVGLAVILFGLLGGGDDDDNIASGGSGSTEAATGGDDGELADDLTSDDEFGTTGSSVGDSTADDDATADDDDTTDSTQADASTDDEDSTTNSTEADASTDDDDTTDSTEADASTDDDDDSTTDSTEADASTDDDDSTTDSTQADDDSSTGEDDTETTADTQALSASDDEDDETSETDPSTTTTTEAETTTTTEAETTTTTEAETTTTTEAETTTTTEAAAESNEPEPAQGLAQASPSDDPIDMDDAAVQILHGVPGAEVDLYVNGEAVVTNFQAGTIAGPVALDRGDYDVALYPAAALAPASTDDREDEPIATGTVTVGDGVASVVAHLGSDGSVVLTPFAESMDQVGPGDGRVAIRHVMAAEDLDVSIDGEIEGSIGNGAEVVTEVEAGSVLVELLGPDGEVVASATVPVGDGELVSLSAIGNPADDSVDLLIQRYRGLSSAPAEVPTGDSGLLGSDDGGGSALIYGLIVAMLLGGGVLTYLRRRPLAP